MNNYNIKNIYCISFGSLIGFFYVNGKLNELQKLLLNSNNDTIKKVFDLWGFYSYFSKIPIFGKILTKISDLIWIIKGLYMKGLYNSNFGNTILDDLIKNINYSDNITRNNLSKFNCFVFNITKNKIEMINGLHPQIKEYIIASICCWGLFPPIKIMQPDGTYNEYLDAGFIQVHPFQNLITKNNTKYHKKKYLSLLIMTNTINNMKNTNMRISTNLIEYLINIISYLIDRNDSELIYNIKHKNSHVIQYLPKVSKANEFDKVKIQNMIDDGFIHADQFLNKIIKL
jgi:predicted acylesterase/phospholipase RssA